MIVAALGLLGPIAPGRCETFRVTPEGLVKSISKKYGDARQYAYEGRLEIVRRSGENRKDVLANTNIVVGAMALGKYRIRIKDDDKSEYLLVSDGQQAWTYVPRLNEYMERRADGQRAAIGIGDLIELSPSAMSQRIIGECARLVVPILAGLAQTPHSSFLTGPVLAVVTKKDAQEHQTMAYVTVDPATLAISRISWMAAGSVKGEKVILRLDIDFIRFQVGAPATAADFTFVPPADAKLVDDLPDHVASTQNR
jgi:outer membrane lipoprotein-sorting protein